MMFSVATYSVSQIYRHLRPHTVACTFTSAASDQEAAVSAYLKRAAGQLPDKSLYNESNRGFPDVR